MSSADDRDGVPAQGDLHELKEFYDREIDCVWRTLGRLGVAPRDRADLAHEVFLVVYRKRPDFDPSRPIRPWLFGITVRVVLGFKRRAAGQEILVDLSEERGEEGQTPEASTATSERLALALRALHSIPLERRVLFIRHRVDGESIVDLAAEMGIPVNTAYSRLRLARGDFERAIRASLGDDGHEE